jgi:hypothetical protein
VFPPSPGDSCDKGTLTVLRLLLPSPDGLTLIVLNPEPSTPWLRLNVFNWPTSEAVPKLIVLMVPKSVFGLRLMVLMVAVASRLGLRLMVFTPLLSKGVVFMFTVFRVLVSKELGLRLIVLKPPLLLELVIGWTKALKVEALRLWPRLAALKAVSSTPWLRSTETESTSMGVISAGTVDAGREKFVFMDTTVCWPKVRELVDGLVLRIIELLVKP